MFFKLRKWTIRDHSLQYRWLAGDLHAEVWRSGVGFQQPVSLLVPSFRNCSAPLVPSAGHRVEKNMSWSQFHWAPKEQHSCARERLIPLQLPPHPHLFKLLTALSSSRVSVPGEHLHVWGGGGRELWFPPFSLHGNLPSIWLTFSYNVGKETNRNLTGMKFPVYTQFVWREKELSCLDSVMPLNLAEVI